MIFQLTTFGFLRLAHSDFAIHPLSCKVRSFSHLPLLGVLVKIIESMPSIITSVVQIEKKKVHKQLIKINELSKKHNLTDQSIIF